MSSKNEHTDGRQYRFGTYGSFALVGEVTNRVSAGGNYPKGHPSAAPHAYHLEKNRTLYGMGEAANGIVYPLNPRVLPPVGHFDANANNKLILKLGNKLRATDFDASVSIAGLPQSLRLIGDTAHSIAKCFDRLRHGNIMGAARALGLKGTKKHGTVLDPRTNKIHNLPDGTYDYNMPESFGQAVLAVQYGWRPLLADVHDSMGGLAAVLNKPRTTKVRTRVQVGGSRLVQQDAIYRQVYYTKKNITLFLQEENNPANGSHINQLNLDDPLAAAWELTPWSFVADWFIPIGSFLASRSARKRLLAANGVYVISTKTVSNTELITLKPISLANGDVARAFASDETVSFDRLLSPYPPELQAPSFKPISDAASLEHALNGISLLVTNWGTGGKKSF